MEFNLQGDKLELVVTEDLVASNLENQMDRAKKALATHPDLASVELNLQHVQEIDSLGVNLVVALYKEVVSREQQFMVSNASRSIKNLFQLFKLNTYFEIL